MVSYELEVEELNDGEIVYVKGRHDPRLFADQVGRYLYERFDYDDPPSQESLARIANDTRYEWWRFVPSAHYSEWRFLKWPAKPGSRGAFEVTVVYL